MQLYFRTVLLFGLISSVLTVGVEAYCAKCTRIEQERAAHPQPIAGYYDDQIDLHDKRNDVTATDEEEQATSVNKNKQPNSPSDERNKSKLTIQSKD